MLVGIPPFYSKNQDRMFLLIKEHKVCFPTKNIKVSDEAKDLIVKV